MTYEEILDKWLRKLGRPCTAGEIVHDLRQLERPVRCKDCVNRGWESECSLFESAYITGGGDEGSNFYCAWGERREDGEADPVER